MFIYRILRLKDYHLLINVKLEFAPIIVSAVTTTYKRGTNREDAKKTVLQKIQQLACLPIDSRHAVELTRGSEIACLAVIFLSDFAGSLESLWGCQTPLTHDWHGSVQKFTHMVPVFVNLALKPQLLMLLIMGMLCFAALFGRLIVAACGVCYALVSYLVYAPSVGIPMTVTLLLVLLPKGYLLTSPSQMPGPEPDLANLLKDGVWTMSQKFDHSIVTFGLMELIMMISRKFGSLTFIRNLEADLLRLSCVKKCLPSSSPSATQLLSSPV
jgi:hypothetical protein